MACLTCMPLSTLWVLFPHQLFEIPNSESKVALVEEPLFWSQFAFHKQKLIFHRASMKAHQAYLEECGHGVEYCGWDDSGSGLANWAAHWAARGIALLRVFELHDDWLQRRLVRAAKQHGLELEWHECPNFMLSTADLDAYFAGKSKYLQANFYQTQRKRFGYLMEAGKPLGGKWSFDEDNRLPFPKDRKAPDLPAAAQGEDAQAWAEAARYIEQHFAQAPGAEHGEWSYAVTRKGAQAWLQEFLEQRFYAFGRYEDAIQQQHTVLHHSLLSVYLNAGLLNPKQILDAAVEKAQRDQFGLNEVEGFVRQVLGWREFILGVYRLQGRKQRTRNYWGFSRKIPSAFYAGNTGIVPVDAVIKRVLNNAYCHHIERLMVLSNFMLLCEFDPDEVYRWFMELFIDAYDWVMVPNVYGMGQFADGGVMSTKPYISGSAYILRMSNFTKGPWTEVWDALYWRFIHVHRDFFLQNPRMGVMVKSFDRMSDTKKHDLLSRADAYLKQLDSP